MKESARAPGNGHLANQPSATEGNPHYVAALTSEPPNPHVNTFSGKLTLPPVELAGTCHDIPLGAENILLRGAVLRNTEWAIGLACFTGTDTKLVQNSFDTPSKFSQLDVLMNKTVVLIIVIMILCISYLATQSVISNDQQFNNIW
jgi:magnesium-transporting ATPase (P-type)